MRRPANPQNVMKRPFASGLILLVGVCVFQASSLLGQADEPVTVIDSIRTPIPRRNLKLAPSAGWRISSDDPHVGGAQYDPQLDPGIHAFGRFGHDHAGLMSHDVAAIYTSGPSIAGSTVCYNWVHNCHPEIENGKNIGLGIRADDQCRNMSVHHNVVWDVGLDGIIMKGEYHKVYNNTTLHSKPEFRFGNSIRMDTEPEPYKAWRMDSPLFSEQNAHSLVFNNVTGLIRAEHRKSTPFVHQSNAVHNELNYTPELRGPEHFDFRPKDDSSLIDGGVSMPGLTDSFLGDAPDIGAYEYGGIQWRPGYQHRAALFYRNNKAYDKLTD